MESKGIKTGGATYTAGSASEPAEPSGSPQTLEQQLDQLTRGIWDSVLGAPVSKAASIQKGSLFQLMLEKDKQRHFAEQSPAGMDAIKKRIFIKHVARALHETPYGASVQEIKDALLADPHIKAVKPDLSLDDVEALALEEMYRRKVYFEGRWGSEEEAFKRANGRIEGTLEQHLALLKEVLAAPPQILVSAKLPVSLADRWGGVDSVTALLDIEISDATKGDPNKAPEHHQARYGKLVDRNTFLAKSCLKPNVSPEILCLRRTLQGVAPHLSFEQIAQAHNRWADYYALYTGGPKRFTAAEVEDLLRRFPDVLGSEELYERRIRFRADVEAALLAAVPGENLYAVLERACTSLEVSRGPGATLLPEDLLAYVLGSESLFKALSEHFDHQNSDIKRELYPTLARQVLDVFGDRLDRYSISEIAMRMAVDDPRFSQGLLVDLIAERPELGGEARFAKAQRNFVIAAHVATAMHRIWAGASFEDVARCLVSLGPRGQVPPDFSAKDVEILQGYDFMPKWPGGKKPDAQVEQDQLAQSALMRELQFPLSLLFPADASLLRKTIIKALIEDPKRTTLPKPLIEEIQKAYGRALRQQLADMFGASKRGPGYGGEEEFARFERFLEGAPGSEMSEAELKELLTNSYYMKNVLHSGSALAHVLAKVADGSYEECIVDRAWTFKSDLGIGRKIDQADAAVATLFSFRSAQKELLNSLELHGFRTQRNREALERFGLIPMVLEATQKVVDAVTAECKQAERPLPFAGKRVVMVQHELGDAYAQVRAYTQLGMDPAKCTFVGIPYHPNPEVEEALVRSAGVEGRFSAQGDIDAFHRAIETAIDEAVASHVPGEQMLIVCDGPYARDYFDRVHLAKNPALGKDVVFTEQTSRGDRARHRADMSKRVVSYARHPQKKREAEYVGRVGVRAVEDVLFELKDTFENKPILINALGPIGMAAAVAFKARGAIVYAYDPNPTDEIKAWAKEHGIELKRDGATAAKGMFLIAGAAGDTSINAAQIDASEPGCYFVSLSSELLEIDLKHLGKRSTGEDGELRRMLAARVNQQSTYYHWLEDGTVRIVIAGGMPANFNNLNSMPPEISDYTIAMSVAAGVEAVESKELGYFTLQKFSDFIYDDFTAFLEKWAARGRGGEA